MKIEKKEGRKTRAQQAGAPTNPDDEGNGADHHSINAEASKKLPKWGKSRFSAPQKCFG